MTAASSSRNVFASITVGKEQAHPSSPTFRASSRRFYYQSVTERADSKLFLAQSIKSIRHAHQKSQRLSSTVPAVSSRSQRNHHPLFQSAHLQQLELAYLQAEEVDEQQDEDALREIDEYYDFDSTGQLEASDFLDHAMNVELLQNDLAAAEQLFFQQHPLPSVAETESSSTASDESSSVLFSITPLNISKYNTVEHKWHQKPFVIQHMMVFFGMIPQERMETVVQNTLGAIQKHAPQCWNGDDLVMSNVGRLFGCKLYLPIHNEHEWPSNGTTAAAPPTDNNTSDSSSSSGGAFIPKLEYLSGVWLSKVYMGNAHQHFHEWIEDAQDYIKAKYGLQVHPHDGHSHWFVAYPTTRARHLVNEDKNESVVVFFIKVSDVLTI